MKRSILLLIPALLITLIFSCKKEDGGEHNTVVPGSGFRSLEEAVNSTAPIARSTSFGVASGDTLIGPGGTRFVIPPNVFETLTGGKVTGSVDITINDWLQKGDMVFGRVLPLTYGEPLLSGGEAFIKVTQNGQVLRVRRDTAITVLFPQFGVSTGGMKGWVGRTMAGSANTVNWLSVDSPVLYVSTPILDTITVRADTLHYIQAGTPLSFPSYSTFTVRLNTPVVLENSMAVVLYDNLKSVFPLPGAQNGQVNATRVPRLPAHIAVMGINQGNFYGGIVAVPDPASDSTYTVIMKAMEPPTLKLQLNAL